MDIVLASAQSELRVAIQILLYEEPGTDVVGTASSVAGLRALLQATHPDLVLLDWALPGLPVTELLIEAKTLDPQPQVIVLGSDLDVKPTALAAGADSFVLKGDSPRYLLTAIREVRSRRAPTMDNETTEKKTRQMSC